MKPVRRQWCMRYLLVAAAAWTFCQPCSLLADEPFGIRVEANATADNNVTRSRGADKLDDVTYGTSAALSHATLLSEHIRLSLAGTAGVERFAQYDRLSRKYLMLNGEIQYRPSGAFDAPTFGVFASGAKESYKSSLRDGYRYSIGASVLQPVSTDLNFFGAVAYNLRDGRSKVFDDKDYSIRFNLDYAVGARGTLYGGGEFRRGDIVSTARPALNYLDVANAIVRDDAFTDEVRVAYRLRAKTLVATAGYNVGLRTDHSLDIWLRWAGSTSLARPTYPGGDHIRYYDVQAGVAYLIRF